jgi:glycerophosphoryl diester phosphodiesterase
MSFSLIAHRGFSSRAPENTIPAFDMAIEAGCGNFELDAQLTNDGAVVVIHDDTVDRTTDGAGAVARLTLEEIQALDAGARAPGNWFAGRTRVPTLDEVLERYAGRAHIHLELKSREEALPGAVVELLLRRGWLGFAAGEPYAVPGLTITSFSQDQLLRSRDLLPELRHGWLVGQIDDDAIAQARANRLQGLYPRAATATAETVGQARNAGFTVRGWGVRDEGDLRRLIDAGAEGTTVDWPDRARRLLDTLRLL